VLELSPQFYGFNDTDSPTVMLAFLREHSSLFALAGVALFVMAISLTILCFAVSDVLRRSARQVGARSVTTFGLIAAASFFLLGIVRFANEPMLYIDSLDHDWGEAAYLATQMVGTHGFGQGGLMALCVWALGVAFVGLRTRVLSAPLALLAVLPAVRLFGLLAAPFGLLPEGLWIVAILAIPGSLISAFLLGLAIMRSRAD
jgi:hypothetical protein